MHQHMPSRLFRQRVRGCQLNNVLYTLPAWNFFGELWQHILHKLRTWAVCRSAVRGFPFCASHPSLHTLTKPTFFLKNRGSLTCTSCPTGKFSNIKSATAATDCAPCAAGSYGVSEGSTSSGCLLCPPGTFRYDSGASDISQCLTCAPGYIASQAGTKECSECPIGYYSSSDLRQCNPVSWGFASRSIPAPSAFISPLSILYEHNT